MSNYNQICMISGLPIRRTEKVNIFFLASTGNYKNNETIMVGDLIYPWSAFKVIAGISVEAIYNKEGNFEVIKNRRSEIVLSYIKDLSKKESLSYEEIFKLISNGEIKIGDFNKNIYISPCVVSNDIYCELIDISTENFGTYIEKDFKRYHKNLEKSYLEDNMNDFLRDEIILPEIGYLQQYIYGKKNPYSYMKSKIDIDYNNVKFLEDFKQDILIVESMKNTGILFSPTIKLNEDLDSNLKSKILEMSLRRSLKQNENEEYLQVNYNIEIFQTLTLNEIEIFFEELEDNTSERYLSLLRFKNENKENKIIKKEEIKDYSFLYEFLIDKNKDILIKI